MNNFDLITGFFEKIVTLYQALRDFLLTGVKIPLIGTVSMWQLLGGSGIAIILTVVIVKAFI